MGTIAVVKFTRNEHMNKKLCISNRKQSFVQYIYIYIFNDKQNQSLLHFAFGKNIKGQDPK